MNKAKVRKYQTSVASNEFTCSISFDAANLSKHLNQQTASDLWRPLVKAYGTEFLLNYHAQNMSSYFVNSVVKFSPGNLATVQSTQNLYGGNYGGLKNYFTFIRNYFGQGLYDQIKAGFMKQSSVYTDSLRLEEWHMYGSSRIGIYQTNKAMAQRTVRIENGVTNQLSNTHIEQLSLSRFYTESGAKRYELTNHLGNVLTVVTDKKLPICSSNNISYFIADITSATDYSPFGAPLAERTWQGSKYRYGFNTQERDEEIAGPGNIMTAEYWEYDTRLGRRWNTDPAFKRFPWQSPYSSFDNNPILKNDPMGDAPPNNTVIKNTINSITKNKDSYTISETTTISKTNTNEIVNNDGTRTVESTFIQTKIVSITTISNSGRIFENSSESTTYSRSESNTYYDLGAYSFYKSYGYDQNIIKESYKTSNSDQFVVPVAQVVQYNLSKGFTFPINDDMQSVKAMEAKSEWMGDKYFKQKDNRVTEPGIKYYKKGHDIQLEIFNKGKYEIDKNKEPSEFTFIRKNDYDLYKKLLKIHMK